MISEYASQEAEQLKTAKTKIQQLIEALPENDKIDRVSKNAFVMSSSELTAHDNWTPGYHDFQQQYALVLSRLESVKSIAEFDAFLSKAIETKQIKKGTHTYKLHPTVVDELRNLK